MQVTKGTWRMREQCVPGSLSTSPAQEPGNEAIYVDTQTHREGSRGFFPRAPKLVSKKGPHKAYLLLPSWAPASCYFTFHCTVWTSKHLGRIISNAFSKGWLV